jgi:hypothetical protein
VIIGAWCKLVEDTKAKCGVDNNDVYNFDETGFQMGIIGSMKIVADAERRARPELIDQAIASGLQSSRASVLLVCNRARPHLCLVQGGRYTARLESLCL